MNINQLKHKAVSIIDKVFRKDIPKTAPVRKLMEESEELLESLMLNEDPSEEFADCFLTLIDAYRRHFGDQVDMQKLIDDSSKKLDIVAGRKWGEPDEHGVHQHIKDEVESWDDGGVSTGLNEDITDEKPGGYQYDHDYDGSLPAYPDESLKLPDEDEDIRKEWKPEFDVNQIQKAYDDVVVKVSVEMMDEVTRGKIKELMEERLPSDLKVKCDEENNPPDVQERGEMWVRVSNNDGQYLDLVF